MDKIQWEMGTAFDLFVSLCVLTDPGRYGLRPTWAAGVRSRLAAEDRGFIEQTQPFVRVPIAWLMNLTVHPKTASAALAELAALAPESRLGALTINPATPNEVRDILIHTFVKGSWDIHEHAVVKAHYRRQNILLKPTQMEALHEAWMDPVHFGERYLMAVRRYYELYFVEGESSIHEAQKKGLTAAQRAADQVSAEKLLEALSQGIQFDEYFHVEGEQPPDFVLAPSYWSSPLIHLDRIDGNTVGVVFGCRDDNEGLVPGEIVPPMLMARLKALSDPTRLRILRYLAQEPLTPSQLAKKLGLRPPTVIHHLNQLRLAGLVQIILLAGGKRRYAFRSEGAQDAMQSTLQFILAEDEKSK
jgi:DNA-binding transcriptional ArsR family regulator